MEAVASLPLPLLLLRATAAANVTAEGGADGGGGSSAVGYLLLIIAMLLFGTCFVPVKRVDCGDGASASLWHIGGARAAC